MKQEEIPLETMQNRAQYKHQVSQYTYWTPNKRTLPNLSLSTPSYVIHVQPPSDTLPHTFPRFPHQKRASISIQQREPCVIACRLPFQLPMHPSPANSKLQSCSKCSITVTFKELRFMLVKNSSCTRAIPPLHLFVHVPFRIAVRIQVHVKLGYANPLRHCRHTCVSMLSPQPRSPWPFSE